MSSPWRTRCAKTHACRHPAEVGSQRSRLDGCSNRRGVRGRGQTGSNVGKRFVVGERLAAFARQRQSRPSHVRKVEGQGEARLIALGCSDPREGFSQWTLHLLADRLVDLQVVERISIETVRQTLKKTSYARIGGRPG